LIIKLTLLSDALTSSGESINGYIDQDIVKDDFGLPYIPAKRLKGILRASARDLKDFGKIDDAAFSEIFGKDGHQKGSLHIDNGHLENFKELRTFLSYIHHNDNQNSRKTLQEIFNPAAVVDYFTYTRTQTAIDRESRVAFDHSLRVSRVLRKGLTFFFKADIEEKDVKIFEQICKVTRSFGRARTRGLGEIKVELLQPSDLESPDSSISSNKESGGEQQTKHDEDQQSELLIKITSESPLLLFSQVENTLISQKYIPGSFIRGAVGQLFIKNKNLLHGGEGITDPDFKQIFYEEKVTFSNLYPDIDNKKFIPVPLSFVTDKNGEQCYDLSYPDDYEEVINDGMETRAMNGFINISSTYGFQHIDIPTRLEYHHRRPEKRGIGHVMEKDQGSYSEKGYFFSYTWIPSNLKFTGKIKGPYKLLKIIQQLLQEIDFVSIGRSTTAQYGKCGISTGEITIANTRNQRESELEENLVITLVSDMVLRSPNGYVKPDPELLKAEICKCLGIDSGKVEILHAFLHTTLIGGYMNAWKLPKHQYPALSAGTVIVLKFNNINCINLKKLPTHYGLMQAEGYGEVQYNYHGSRKLGEKTTPERRPPSSDFLKDISMESTVIKLSQFIFRQHLKDEIVNQTIKETGKKAVKFQRSLKNSFIQRLLSLYNNSNDVTFISTELGKLASPGREKLEKLAKLLYLKTDNKNNIHFEVKFDNNRFNSILDKYKIVKTDVDVRNLITSKLEKITDPEDILYGDNHLEEFYLHYSRSLLTNLLFRFKQLSKNTGGAGND